MKAQFTIMVIAASVIMVLGTVEAQVYQTQDISVNGNINNTPFTMTGSTVYSLNPGSLAATHVNTWTFSSIPPGMSDRKSVV